MTIIRLFKKKMHYIIAYGVVFLFVPIYLAIPYLLTVGEIVNNHMYVTLIVTGMTLFPSSTFIFRISLNKARKLALTGFDKHPGH